ncbi:MAG TPA: 4-alpha-glucanotransferase [Vicinamibacterales bacterium]|nr:4-alpha-glucanotransferase [Vicinamibacterales bacterium]
MPRDFFHGRHAGMLVPLFSVPSRESWGIGELGDLPRLGRWMGDAGFSFLQLLPVNEMAEGQNSPYSAMSAMAIDPIYISPASVPDIGSLGGESLLTRQERALLAKARASKGIEYTAVRTVKRRAFRAAFEHFKTKEWEPKTNRAIRLKAFIDQAGWWLDDYALFRALHARENGRAWQEWAAPIRDRTPEAIARARAELADEILFYSYLQWAAYNQWRQSREACGIGVFGDFPFMVSGDSADVWARQEDFRLDASVGAPPDAFSETGQDWGFPAYRWDTIRAGGYRWLADRARRSRELYNGYRVDHLVGFFRTYAREKNGKAAFVPPDEPSQIAQGQEVLEVLGRTGARIIAEDLGVIPDFVRETLARLGIPGYKVLRWEREWKEKGKPFKDPRTYPRTSVATSGTHDTETLAEWWDTAPPVERAALASIDRTHIHALDLSSAFTDRIRDAILELLYAAASDIVLLPIQDVFGWKDRINTPALISDENWTWRLPWLADDMSDQSAARERAIFTRALAEKYHR